MICIYFHEKNLLGPLIFSGVPVYIENKFSTIYVKLEEDIDNNDEGRITDDSLVAAGLTILTSHSQVQLWRRRPPLPQLHQR